MSATDDVLILDAVSDVLDSPAWSHDARLPTPGRAPIALVRMHQRFCYLRARIGTLLPARVGPSL